MRQGLVSLLPKVFHMDNSSQGFARGKERVDRALGRGAFKLRFRSKGVYLSNKARKGGKEGHAPAERSSMYVETGQVLCGWNREFRL
jgi:hypothetical protein